MIEKLFVRFYAQTVLSQFNHSQTCVLRSRKFIRRANQKKKKKKKKNEKRNNEKNVRR